MLAAYRSPMLNDLRYAFRSLFKTPGFTAAAVFILALAIGVNTAVFSLVHTVLFSPAPYAHPAEIVQVFSQDRKNPQSFRSFSYPTYLDLRAHNTVFSGVLAYNLTTIGLGEKSGTRRAFAAAISSNYFSVLGVAPAQGRAFLPEEETPGRNAAVAIVSHTFWKKSGYDPALLGSSIQINSRPFTVVGIMPEGFTGTMRIISTEVWLPLGVYDWVANAGNPTLTERNNGQLMLIGRLKPGLTAATAAPALQALAANQENAFPVEAKDQTYVTAPLSRFSSSTAPTSADNGIGHLGALLLGMAGVVLLVASINLANMLLARGAARRKEIAIRLALGGSRARIVRQLLIEGLVLSLLGGICGIILSLWSSDLLVRALSHRMPFDIVWPTGPNPALLAAAFGFCLLGTLCFALGPSLKLSRGKTLHDLKGHAGEDPVSRRRWKFLPRHPLVVAQIALSFALLTAAALFIRGAGQAGSFETGLRADHDFLIELDSQFSNLDQAQAGQLYDRLQQKLSALPGVESASIASSVPFGLTNRGRAVQRAGLHPAPGTQPATAAEGRAFSVRFNSVGADYFQTVGLPLLRGRPFSAAESTGTGRPGIAIIDESLAHQLWPKGDALGQRIQYPGDKSGETFEIVGIAPDVRTALFEPPSSGTLYLPFARGFQSNAFFYVKVPSLSPDRAAAMTNLLRRTIHEINPRLPVLSIKTFAQHVDSNVQLWIIRAGAALFSIFGGLALGLAAVGVYGVKAYSVARRTREIGIRLAIGAQPGTVQWMILREGGVMLTGGILLGFILALGTGRLLSGLLYHISATDPVAFIVAPFVLIGAVLLACWLPARRATKVDPLTALRAE
jgi:predicted permease